MLARPRRSCLTVPASVDRARRILAAADSASLVDGEMVDAATKRLAAAVLARASGA